MVRIENLSVEFFSDSGNVLAVRGLDLLLEAGKTTGLVGESGSGKSVTALAVMGLLNKRISTVQSGHIWFAHPQRGDIDLLQLPASDMQSIRGRHISMVFQEPMSSLNPVKRCGWQVEEVIHHHGLQSAAGTGALTAKQHVLALFEEVMLPDPLKVYRAWPHELSGGMRQRVMIAMAMACRPNLLIADEPTTALDVTVQKSILQLMKQLQQDHGMAILFISHDLGIIGEIASDVGVMYQGQVVEHGTVEAILGHPKHAYTKALIACRPPLSGRPHRLAVVSDYLTAEGVPEQDDGPKGLAADAKAPESPADVNQWRDTAKLSQEERKDRHQAMYAGDPILKVRDLHTSFVTARNIFGKITGHHQALHKVSFDVYQSETLGLVGESGCGKTTLGRSILRLVQADGGQVIYKGVDVNKMSAASLRRIRPKFQIIFQDPYASLTPGMMVGHAILEPMRIHGILSNDKQRKKKIIELLERVSLEERHFTRYPHQFSGGQRQRICIARALALQPEFIICDEAVSALDVSVQAQVLNVLNDLKQAFNLTYIFISHDLSVVKYMSDRVIVMKDGHMLELAEADSLYENPATSYTKQLISAIPQPTYLPSSHP